MSSESDSSEVQGPQNGRISFGVGLDGNNLIQRGDT